MREDKGLFKREIVTIVAQLTPVVSHTGRHDLVILGFTGGGQQFEVVIAGRRAVMAAPLIANLAAVKEAFVKKAQGRPLTDQELYGVRVPVTCEGAWRTRIWVDRSGWQSRMHQFVVTRWRIGTDGGSKMYGAAIVDDA
ncbi:MAG: hypothetical protein AAFQ64_11885 [Pseudomonadota bacterium]